MPPLPKPYERFQKKYADVWAAYDKLGLAANAAGPLDEKTRELVKLGLAIGARLEGAVHSHTRRALEAGASSDEIHQVALLAAPTLGFPHLMVALTWIDDVLLKK
jgi:4-carboxymuconolactone decarboxylase